MTSNSKLTELQKISGIADFSKLSEANANKIVQLLEKGKIDISHITALMVQNGGFYAQVTEALRLGVKVAEGAKHNQSKALDSLTAQIESADKVYVNLSKNAKSDETIEQLSKDRIEIGKQNLEAIEMIKEINNSNNEVWKTIAKQSLIVLGMVAISIIGASAVKSNDNNSGGAA